MKFLVQRVNGASVEVENKIVGKINKGFLVLIGITHNDNKEIADYLIKKLINLRVFEDENQKMNLNINQVNGELLLISQFTLYANCKKGYRPSFTESGSPDLAEELYEYIIASCKETVPVVEKGSFGADMKVSLINDGPFTIVLDSEQL